MTQPLEVREQAAGWVRELTNLLPLDDILSFAASSKPGERVAAGIALGQHLQSNPKAQTDPRIRQAFIAGLTDPYSRVRYRFVESLEGQSSLVSFVREKLQQLLDDENPVVRKAAKDVLVQY